MIVNKENLIRERLEIIFNKLGKEKSQEIAFHLTDWISDLEEVYKIYSKIEKISNEEIELFIYKFLAHVPNHLVAAKKLSGIGSTEDVFNVGIFEDDK